METVTLDEYWEKQGWAEVKLWGACDDDRYLSIFNEEVENAGLQDRVIQLSVPSDHYTDLFEELKSETERRIFGGVGVASARKYKEGDYEVLLKGHYLDEPDIKGFYPKHWSLQDITTFLIRHELAHIKNGDCEPGNYTPTFIQEFRADWYAAKMIDLGFVSISL